MIDIFKFSLNTIKSLVFDHIKVVFYKFFLLGLVSITP